MRSIQLLILSLIILGTSPVIKAQIDSLLIKPSKSNLFYIGIGKRIGTEKSIRLNMIFIHSSNWGLSFNISKMDLRSKNIPDSFNTVNLTGYIPHDYYHFQSLTLVREFPTRVKQIRFGLEAGLLWVNYSIAEFIYHPSFQDLKFDWLYFIFTGDEENSWIGRAHV